MAALEGRSPFDQSKALLDVLLGRPSSLEEVELRLAATDLLLAILEPGHTATTLEVVQIFVASYIFNIAVVELGEKLRPSDDALAAELQLRDWIDGAAQHAVTQQGAVAPGGIERAIETTLERTRQLLHRWRRGRTE